MLFISITTCVALLSSLATLVLLMRVHRKQKKLNKRIVDLAQDQQRISINEFRQVAAFNWLNDYLKPSQPFPALRGWACSPDFALSLIQNIDHRQPRTIVEFGGGSSTAICATHLNNIGQGYIYSFDHDESFAQNTRDDLCDRGLQDLVDLQVAPLMPSSRFGSSQSALRWYDTDVINRLPDHIDMIIIDGPPNLDGDSMARYPALPALYDKLSPKCVLLLDDAERAAETAVIQRWLHEFPEFKLQRPTAEKGAAVLYRQG